MKTLFKIGFLAFLLGMTTACNQQSANTTGVIDLGKISKETGQAEKIDAELKIIRNRLQSELQTVQTNLQKNFQENQKKFGKTPTEEQRAQLVKSLASAQQKLQQARNSATIELKNKEAELVFKLKSAVHPVAEKIAKKRGMTLILIKNDSLILSIDDKIDLTDAVIAELKKGGGGK